MAELIEGKAGGALDFGDYTLESKTKKEDYKFEGNVYKVKTFKEITKLEKNGLFVYESVPGSKVTGLKQSEDGVSFQVEAEDDIQITLELEPGVSYDVNVGGKDAGAMTTNLGGKLSLSVEISGAPVSVTVKKA